MQDGEYLMSVKSPQATLSQITEIAIEMKQRAQAMQSELREAEAQRRSASVPTHSSSGRTVGFVKRSRQLLKIACTTEHSQIHR